MGLDHGPTPVIRGLILNYDIANFRSYSGSGNTINNIIQSSFGATLSNSPTYSSGNRGFLTFARASSQFGTFPHFGSILTNFTVEAWYWINSLPSDTTVQALVTQQFTSGKINFSLGFNGTRGSGTADTKINGGFFDTTWQLTDGFTPVINTWYQSVVTYDGTIIIQYTNGSQIGSTTPNNPAPSIGTQTNFNYLMRRWDTTNFIDGRLAVVRIYNRALSASEITQNFNANRERFGI